MYEKAIQMGWPAAAEARWSPKGLRPRGPTKALYEVKPSSGPSPAEAIWRGPAPTIASNAANPALGKLPGFVAPPAPITVNAITPRPDAVTPTAGYVRLLSASARTPCRTTLPDTEFNVADGWMMYEAMPAFVAPP